jgi:hypothetical protein
MAAKKESSPSRQGGVADLPAADKQGPGASHGGAASTTGPATDDPAAAAHDAARAVAAQIAAETRALGAAGLSAGPGRGAVAPGSASASGSGPGSAFGSRLVPGSASGSASRANRAVAGGPAGPFCNDSPLFLAEGETVVHSSPRPDAGLASSGVGSSGGASGAARKVLGSSSAFCCRPA